MKCQHCNEPNPEGYFNCPSCGQRAAKSKWNTTFVIRENTPWARAIRQDKINFGTKDMDKHIKETKKKNEETAKKKLYDSISWDRESTTVKT